MKIVHVTEAWNGGVATYVNTLLRHQSADHDVTLIYSRDQTQKDFDESFYRGHAIKALPYTSSRNPAKFPGIAREIGKILRHVNPDIVHLHSTFPGVYVRLFESGFPVVYCPHGWSFVQEEGALKKKIYTGVEKYLARRSDAIINISEHEHTEARQAGIKARLSIVIPSGVDDVKPANTPAIDINPDHINIGFIGRLDYKKGFDIAAQAFAGLSRRDVHLHVIGEASRDGHGDTSPQAPNIHYLGWVNNTDIDAYIKLFDAVIVPSRQEGFGLVAVEAMRNAKPAIVSTAGGLPELIKNDYNGYIFQTGDLPVLLGELDKEKLKIMGRNARDVYEQKYTSARAARDIMDLYSKVLYTRKTSS